MDPRIKQGLAGIINNPNSNPEKVHNAVAYLLGEPKIDADRDFCRLVHSLQIHHPHIAKERFPLLQERYVLKDLACATDGYSG